MSQPRDPRKPVATLHALGLAAPAILAVLCLTASALHAQGGCSTGPRLEVLGVGTAGTPGTPALNAEGLPVVDGPFSLAIAGGLPSASALVLVGLETSAVFLPKYGATVYPGGPFFTTIPITLPPSGDVTLFSGSFDATFCGLDLVLQVAVADPAALGNQAFTNGLRFAVGTPGPFLFSGLKSTLGYDPVDLAITDLDGDGHLDMAVANFYGNTVSLLYGQGDGTFIAAPDLTTTSAPHRLAVADLNGDAVADLAVGLVFDDEVSVFLSTGPQTYAAPLTVPASGTGAVVDVGLAQIDGDALPDLLVTKSLDGGFYVALGQGNGSFGVQTPVAVGGRSSNVLAEDVDGDGNTDLIASNWQVDGISIAFGAGDGSFPFLTSFVTGDEPGEMVYDDVDGDGRRDIAVVCTGEDSVRVHAGGPGALFAAGVVAATSPHLQRLDLADTDADGDLDLLAAWFTEETGGALRFEGTGSLSFGPPVEVAAGFRARDVGLADLDEDGAPDIAVTAGMSDKVPYISLGDVTVHLNDGSGGFGGPVTSSSGADPRAGVTGHFDGDGTLDLVVALEDTQELAFQQGVGDGTFMPGVTIASVSGCYELARGDFDGNGTLDVAALSSWTDQVTPVLGLGNGTFSPQVPFSVPASPGTPGSLSAGDVNGDGWDDVLYGIKTSVTPYLSGGNGTFVPAAAVAFPTSIGTAFELGDVDGDGRLDLVKIQHPNNQVSVALGNGDGSFGSLISGPAGQGTAGALHLADVDGDGLLDLAAAAIGGVIVLVGGGDGTFASAAQVIPTTSSPSWVFAENFNGDGHADIVAVQGVSIDAVLLLGDGSGGYQASERFPLGENLSEIFAVDVDGDGAVDVGALQRFTSLGGSRIMVQLNQILDE